MEGVIGRVQGHRLGIHKRKTF